MHMTNSFVLISLSTTVGMIEIHETSPQMMSSADLERSLSFPGTGYVHMVLNETTGEDSRAAQLGLSQT